MVIFNSYVKLPEGKFNIFQSKDNGKKCANFLRFPNTAGNGLSFAIYNWLVVWNTIVGMIQSDELIFLRG